MPLHALSGGESAVIYDIDDSGYLRRRLMKFGFTRNARVTALFSAIRGGPASYLICDAVVVLRACDAMKVKMKR